MAARAFLLVVPALVAAAGLAAAAADLSTLDPLGLVPPPPSVQQPELPTGVPANPGLGPGAGDSAPSPVPVAPALIGPDGSDVAFLMVAGAVGVLGVAGAAVWGGTRFRDSEEVLGHEVRSRIYQHIQEQVGSTLKDITDHLGLSTTNAVWHLRKLEEIGLVRGRKFNGAKVYYPTAGGVQARNLSIAGAALNNANARAILAFILEHPGAHQREVARLLGVNHGTVRWHLKKLRRAELLEERRTGASAAYHATALGTEAHRVMRSRPLPAAAAAPAAGGVPEETALRPAAGQA